MNFYANFISIRLVCEIGKKGLSIFIDGTYSGSHVTRDALKRTDVPYFTIDYSIQSYVKNMERYLLKRKAIDVVMIFQDANATRQGLFNFVRNSPLRVILLDELRPNVIKRLKTLRPAPNFYAIIADTANMEGLFQTVRHNLHDVALSQS